MTHSAIIVTGSRNWTREDPIRSRLSLLSPGSVVIHGDCRGADAIAADLCPELGLIEVPVPYFDWLGTRGGPERNRVMLLMLLAYRDRGCSVGVEAFPMLGSKGTVGMIKLAQGAGVDVVETWG